MTRNLGHDVHGLKYVKLTSYLFQHIDIVGTFVGGLNEFFTVKKINSKFYLTVSLTG